jgi:hypothetical protein
MMRRQSLLVSVVLPLLLAAVRTFPIDAQEPPPANACVLTLKASEPAVLGRSAAEQVARTYGGELIQLDGKERCIRHRVQRAMPT